MKRKKKIVHLVELSTTKGKLDPKKIKVIAKTLPKRELVSYYRSLIRKREEEKAYVYTSCDMPSNVLQRLKKLFSGKDVVFLQDPSVISGMKIQVGDLIFDASLATYLEEMRRKYEVN